MCFTGIKTSILKRIFSIESTMKLATLLVLSLVILGAIASPQRGGGRGRRGKRKLLEKCGIDRDFCDDGQRPDVRPFPEGERDCSSWVRQELDKGDKPDREDCTVGEEVTFKKAHSYCLKINQNVSFEFLKFGVFHQFLSFQN